MCNFNSAIGTGQLFYSLQLLLPLDLGSGWSDALRPGLRSQPSLVGLSLLPAPPPATTSSAHFLGRPDSHLTVETANPTHPVLYKYGLTVAVWVYIERLAPGERQWLLDASPDCETGQEVHHNFQLYLESGAAAGSGLAAGGLVSGQCGAMPALPAAGSGDIKLVAVLCDGPAQATDKVAAGSCQTFESVSTSPIPLLQWTHVAFSYDHHLKHGTFVINKRFGYQASF